MNGISWKSDFNKRSVAILRVSSAAQRDNTSHDIQEKDVSDYCEKHGLNLVKTYRLSESAKDSDGRKLYHAGITTKNPSTGTTDLILNPRVVGRL